MVDGNTTRNPLVADYSEWRARDYFQTYYSEVVLPDEQAVLAYQIGIQAGSWFIGKDDAGLVYESTGQRKPPLHAAGEGADILLLVL